MQDIGAAKQHPLPAHLMDSQVPCVQLVNTAPQVTGLFSLDKQSPTSSWFSAAVLLMLKCINLQGVYIFQTMFFCKSTLIESVLKSNVHKFKLCEAIKILPYYIFRLQCFIHANYHLVAQRKF